LRYDDEIMLVLMLFRDIQSLYTYPLQSSKADVYSVTNLQSSLFIVPLSHIFVSVWACHWTVRGLQLFLYYINLFEKVVVFVKGREWLGHILTQFFWLVSNQVKNIESSLGLICKVHRFA